MLFSNRLNQMHIRKYGHPLHKTHKQMVRSLRLECEAARAEYDRMCLEGAPW